MSLVAPTVDPAPGDAVAVTYRSSRSNNPQSVTAVVCGRDDDDTAYLLDTNDRKRVLTIEDGTLRRGTIPNKASAFERADAGHRPADPSSVQTLGDVVGIADATGVERDFHAYAPKAERPFTLLKARPRRAPTPTDLPRGAEEDQGYVYGAETRSAELIRRLFDSPGGQSLAPFDLGDRRVMTRAFTPDDEFGSDRTYLTAILCHHFDEMEVDR